MAKILVIEDNPFNMKLTAFLLTNAGYAVVQAVTAEIALELIPAELPDLVLMDVQLPGMDGLEATHLLKSNPKLSHIPILALTAHAMINDQEKMLAAGCDGYMSKPFQRDEFLELVNKLLNINNI